MNKISGIYEIRNITNNKRYIGSSNDIYKRWSRHKCMLIKSTHHCGHLQGACNKYGIENFKFHILIICDIRSLFFYEQLFIDKLRPEYNMAICAEAPGLGLHRSKEVREKISKAKLGIPGHKQSDETRKKISKTMTGVPGHKQSIETIKQMSISRKGNIGYWTGKNRSGETKIKISLAHLGKKLSKETKNKLSIVGKGHPGYWLGKKHSEETKKKMREAQKKRQVEMSIQVI